MKCDDDTFVRIDSILEEVRAKEIPQGLYMGSMNELHRPLRTGKWAVTVEVYILCEQSITCDMLCICSSMFEQKQKLIVPSRSEELACAIMEHVLEPNFWFDGW